MVEAVRKVVPADIVSLTVLERETGRYLLRAATEMDSAMLDREIKRVKNGRVFLIPASDQTAGHGTTGQAKFWKQQLGELLQTAPRGAK